MNKNTTGTKPFSMNFIWDYDVNLSGQQFVAQNKWHYADI